MYFLHFNCILQFETYAHNTGHALIDYDLAFLFQPMLMLGISTGVAFKVMFADWMVTVVLIILFLDILLSSGWYSNKSFKERHINMEERDNDEEGSRKAVGIGVQTWWCLYHTTFTGRSYRCLCIPPMPSERREPVRAYRYRSRLQKILDVSVAFLIVHIVKVASATSTFAMLFSSSMSVDLLNRFPVPYESSSNNLI
ncbi:hypothetical protein L3X38_040385 [Prunus dulcis]|uniref:Uncharacterized protein n=1 Tax=Prunus dulcis TaxID=3755 RepID=A0AAD4YSE0_PRUDU|nr:hypothetical protein L3X38_040385 [Prunus dulcis]